jgi:hypothetical protein
MFYQRLLLFKGFLARLVFRLRYRLGIAKLDEWTETVYNPYATPKIKTYVKTKAKTKGKKAKS